MSAIDPVIDEFLSERWIENPILATQVGIDGFDELLGDYSASSFEHRFRRAEHWLMRFTDLADDVLTFEEQIDRDLIASTLRGQLVLREWAEWKRQPSVYLDPGLRGVFGLFLHRLRPEPDLAKAAIARLLAVPDVLEAGKANLDAELTSPLFVERALSQCKAAITYCRDLVPRDIADDADRAGVAEAGDAAARAYEDFYGFLEVLKGAARGPYALGEELYSAVLREKEMLGYGAREMRERGRAAYDELNEDMIKRARDLRGTDDWRAVLEELSDDHPVTPDAMRHAYERSTEDARRFLKDRRLVTMPDGERCLVEPSPPFQRPIMAVASYMSPPAFKPSLTGHFFVPYPPDGISEDDVRKRLRTNGHHSIPAISVHEAYPGHHWHLITMQANERPVRRIFGTSYFSEGWALYTEVMMREEGFFEQPSHEICQVAARIFRAARVIVDTSLHIGDMHFEQAVRTMREQALSEPTARAEVGRYCTWPTQAPSYLTGALEIERLRARYLTEGRGSLREFHDRIAGSGALPIALAERALFGTEN